MKQLLITFCSVITLLSLMSMNNKSDDWELPIKDDLIQIEYTDSFANKKKDLCSHYQSSINNGIMLMIKTNHELTGKGDRILSNTTFTLGGSLDDKYPIRKCNSGNDTITGYMTIEMGKSLQLIRGLNTNVIQCKVRVIIEDNTLSIRFIGFTLSDLKVNVVKGTAKVVETDLEQVYNEFVTSETKKKSEINFFTDLKMIIDTLHSALVSQLEKDIKVAETE